MIKGELHNGFKYEIEDSALNDWEVLEALNDIDDGDTSKVVVVARKLFSKEQYSAFKESFRSNDGRIPIDKMVEAISEILNSNQETKNF